MRAVALALTLLIARSAHAEEPLVGTLRKVSGIWTDSQEGELRRKVNQVREQIDTAITVANAFFANNRPVDARVDAFAELGAGVDQAVGASEGTAGIVFSVPTARCDLIQLGASVRGDLRTDDP